MINTPQIQDTAGGASWPMPGGTDLALVELMLEEPPVSSAGKSPS